MAIRKDWQELIHAYRHKVHGYDERRSLNDICQVEFDGDGNPKRVKYDPWIFDQPFLTKERFAEMCRKPMRLRSDIEDAAAYIAMGRPRILGLDLARGYDRTVNFARDSSGNRYAFLDGPLTTSDFCFTITQGNPMQDKTPTKQFVTHDVPGFENGHPVHAVLDRVNPESAFETRRTVFRALRTTEEGVEVVATIPISPAAVAAHVRVKAVKPPKVEKKA